MSRERLAQSVQTSTSTISRLELESRIPNAITLLEIAEVLDMDLNALRQHAAEPVS